jgi:hypothetical protein
LKLLRSELESSQSMLITLLRSLKK